MRGGGLAAPGQGPDRAWLIRGRASVQFGLSNASGGGAFGAPTARIADGGFPRVLRRHRPLAAQPANVG
jgi:hypothetical protein